MNQNELAVFALYELAKTDLKLNDQYIFGVTATADGTSVIVTLVPELAAFIHSVEALQVDTTFKRIRDGTYNEWKVVIWLTRLSRRKHSPSFVISLDLRYCCLIPKVFVLVGYIVIAQPKRHLSRSSRHSSAQYI